MAFAPKYMFLLLFLALTWACTDDEQSIQIEIPSTYSFFRDGASSVSFEGQTIRINMASELVTAMNDSEQTATTLVEMYTNETSTGEDANPFSDDALNESTKSVKSKIAASADLFSTNTAYSAKIKADIQNWIEAQIYEVFPNSGNLAQAGLPGQIADGSSARFVNSKGLEYNQAVNKVIIGALMIDQICNNYLSTTVLDDSDNIASNDAGTTVEGKSYTNMEHKWDEAYGYLFGISTDSSNPLSTLGEGNFLNKYLLRVDEDADFAGIATDIFEAFKLGRAAIIAGDYSTRDEQANIIKDNLAQVTAITAIYYLQNGKSALAAQDFGGAFHDLSEGFGFVYSLRFIRKANSTEALFSNEEVDDFISQLLEGNGFWNLEVSTLDAISELIATKFIFTVAQAAE